MASITNDTSPESSGGGDADSTGDAQSKQFQQGSEIIRSGSRSNSRSFGPTAPDKEMIFPKTNCMFSRAVEGSGCLSGFPVRIVAHRKERQLIGKQTRHFAFILGPSGGSTTTHSGIFGTIAPHSLLLVKFKVNYRAHGRCAGESVRACSM